MAARKLQDLPVALALAAAVVVSSPAQPAETHPGRYLEWRRARAAAVYLGTVAEVRQAAPPDGEGGGARMEAAIRVDRTFRGPAVAPTPLPSPAALTPAAAAGDDAFPWATYGGPSVRYEEPGREPREGVFYRLRRGHRVLVFAGSLGRETPLEVLSGSAAELRGELTALRDFAAAMDPRTARLHGVDDRERAAQVALYDAVLAALP